MIHSTVFVLRFFSRKSGQLRFSLCTSYLGNNNNSANTSTKRLVAYIFHPYEPFVISIQKADNDYVVNLHFRNTLV